MDPKISTQFDGFTIEMTLKNGDTYRHTNQYVLGHIKNPMSWSNVTDKFWKCSAHLAVPLLKTQLENVIKLCTNLDVVSDMSELVENLTP